MKDDLGDRMKNYEFSSRSYLGPRSYLVIRLDGKAFHTYTKGLKRPFDEAFSSDMDETARFLCENLQGAKFAYVQSDEISIFITTVGSDSAQPLFKNQVQKIVSISASMASAKFNQLRMFRYFCGPETNIVQENDKTIGEHYEVGTNLEVVRDDISSFINYMPINSNLAFFDARVMCFSDPYEVHNCFVWRQQDATRNSISMAAQSLFSHKELHKKSTNEMQDMMMTQKGVNWNDYPVRFKRGGFICRENYEAIIDLKNIPENKRPSGKVIRSRWSIIAPPIFTKDKEFTYSRIPTPFGPLWKLQEDFN